MALVLSREPKEAVIITLDGRECRVTVLEVRGSKVRLGFSAPREVRIDREEVAERRKDEPPRAA